MVEVGAKPLWRYAGEFAVGGTVARGVFLACVRDIHGAALRARWRWLRW